MKNLEVIIGIETHIVLNTKTKMFSHAKNTHYSEPNTEVSFMDIALPGIMPTVNKKGIEKALILADALNMKINYQNIQFDRKNYFYLDLPKGFQITQQYYPIGTFGVLAIKDRNIEIERIHLEEDTAKKINTNNKFYMDYNRAGIPLIEIVSMPNMHSADEACEYLSNLRNILIFKDISDAKMEDGSMRADINISLRPFGAKWYGNKVEIKNINSLANVKKAIEFEIKRQTKSILTGTIINQETRRFNDTTNETEFMRNKSNAIDYRYITEPNIINFKLEDNFVKNIIKNSNKSPAEIFNKLISNKELNEQEVNLLLDNYDLYKLFDKINVPIQDEKLVYNWVVNEINGILLKNNMKITNINDFFLENIITLLKLLINKEINSKQAKNLLIELFNTKKDIKELIEVLNYKQITDVDIIKKILLSHFANNNDLLEQYSERPERVEKFFVGMVMKDTNSQANPNVTMTVLKELLKNK